MDRNQYVCIQAQLEWESVKAHLRKIQYLNGFKEVSLPPGKRNGHYAGVVKWAEDFIEDAEGNERYLP